MHLWLFSVLLISIHSHPLPSLPTLHRSPRSLIHPIENTTAKKASGRSLLTNNIPQKIQKPKDYEKIVQEARAFNSSSMIEEIIDPSFDEVMGRGGTSDPTLRWSMYKMVVVVDNDYSPSAQSAIRSAIFTLSEAMKCFDFEIVVSKEAAGRRDHLFITKDMNGREGCFSLLGRKGGRQETVVSEYKCNMYGTTMHEIMHVLGFYHEHVRPDRDNYVKIYWDYMSSSTLKHQYKIRDDQVVYSDEYDFDSIMHYPLNHLLEAKPGKIPNGAHPGQRDHLSKMDIKRLQGMYPCEGKLF